jgi:proline dehydrogenase
LTVLDFGAEGKSDEDDLDAVLEENLKAIEMAASNNSVPVISTKVTGLVDQTILEKMQKNEKLSDGEKRKYQHLCERLDEICSKAHELGISVFVDAEESWIQDPIDELVMQMSEKYNKERPTVYNTYQLYLKSKLSHIKRDHARCRQNEVIFGCKMVRGAYILTRYKLTKQRLTEILTTVSGTVSPTMKPSHHAVHHTTWIVIFCRHNLSMIKG